MRKAKYKEDYIQLVRCKYGSISAFAKAMSVSRPTAMRWLEGKMPHEIYLKLSA